MIEEKYPKIVVEKGKVYFLDKATGKMKRGFVYVLDERRDQENPVTIGREGPETMGRIDILLSEEYMGTSRKHCEIFFDRNENAYFLADCSVNGTLVNGNKVGGNRIRETRRLKHYDLIEIPAVGEKVKLMFLEYRPWRIARPHR